MPGFISDLTPFQLTLTAGIFAWITTSLGASVVFFINKINRNLMNGLIGFSAGVMLAALVWSLLIPAIDISKQGAIPSWIAPSTGIIIGMLVLLAIDKILPHLHRGFATTQIEGLKTKWKKTALLFSAITLHNFPEGLVIGVAFGSLEYNLPTVTLAVASALAMGIALQDFPEGIAAALPLRSSGQSKLKSFFYGQLSGFVEPIGALFGYWFVTLSRAVLPYALSFAAGAMLFVIIEQLIPESQSEGNTDIATVFTIFGFVVMMILDISLV